MMYGAKKGQGSQQKPNIAKDTTASTNYAKILYGLCEGEIFGLADGHKSIRLDGTPIINDNGQANFSGVKVDFRTGTLDQEYIAGFPAVENESNVGVELRHDRAWTKAINNTQLSAVRVRLAWNALREQKDNGDIVGYKIEYAIDVQTDGGAFIPVLTTLINDKASQGYKRSHRIDLPKAKNGWTIRVRRITPNRDNELIGDTMYVDALTEIIDAKLTYAGTAMLGLQYDAETFSNIAKVAVRLKGKLLQVPSNYDPETRTYSGLWDGTFKLAYSNNPAWVYYDLCTNKRYALGERLQGMIDKWSLYSLAQYCDEMVDDGKGGQEPRFVCNVYIQKLENAYAVLQSIASIFRAMSYWNGEQIIVDADLPKDPVYTFSRANVVGGNFTYSGTRARDRHTIAKVAWDNPDNEYKTEYEFVRDERAIAKYGIRMLDINILGCTSRGQAQRAGLWALKTEQLETRTVTFKTGLDGFIPQVGQIINIADDIFAGRANGGRVVSVSKDKRMITLDRATTGQTLVVNGTDGKAYRSVINRIDGMIVHLASPIDAVAGAVWAMESDDLRLMQFRVLSIKQDGTTFDIQALQYEPQKFDAIDAGAIIKQAPFSVLKVGSLPAPAQVLLRSSQRVVQGQNITTLSIDFEQVEGAVAYHVEWRKDDNAWMALPKTASQSIDIDNVYSGNYQARVRAIDAFDNESLATTSQLTQITGKIGKPPRPARLYAKGGLFSMELGWIFNAGSDDTNYTEIQVSPDGRSNIATLGTFAYPTDKHTINGLQGNLTQFYRARIVDKLGNVSDWTDWTSGTTEAQADKVLNLLTGQITASQLHQDLSTPIGKINGIESSLQQAISSTASNLDTLNRSISDANSRITQAQSELGSAVSEIGTNKVNIAGAIRDISALRTADSQINTQINGLQSNYNSLSASISAINTTIARDKESLTQQINQAQAAADNTASQLSSVQQALASETQARTTAIDALTARLSNSGNLVGNVTRGQFWYVRSNAPANHNQYSLTDFIAIKPNVNYVIQATNGSLRYLHIAYFTATRELITSQVAVGATAQSHYQLKHATASFIRFSYQHTMTDGVVMTQSDAFANIDSVRDAMTTADSALSQRIDTLDASYKQADNTLNASITAEQQARTSADNALSQRITALDSAYKSADTQANAKIATLEQSLTDKDSAMSRRVDTLQASFGDINARTKTRVNLLPNGGFENGLLGWSAADFALEEHPSFGRIAVISNIANKTGTFTLVSDKMHCEAGRTYVISCDTASHARTCRVYCDLLFYNAQNQIILDGNQSPIEHNHDYAVVQNRHEVATQAPHGAVYMSARFVAENLTGGMHVGVRQVKVEVGHLPSTPYTADTLGKSLTATIDEFKRTEALANGALSQRINALDASYKQADIALNANIAQEQQARVNADNALSQRITALDSAYKSADASLSARVATAEQSASDAQQAIARTQQTLTARIDSAKTVRPNLCPDVDKWTLGYAFYTDKSSDWGMTLKTHANDTRVSLSPKIAVRAGGVYVLSYDSLRYCDGGWVYCDLQGYNAQGQQVWDSDQVSRGDRHDFATDNRNRDVNAIQYTIPQDITHVQVRFVAQSITGNVVVGVRQVKFEYGALPASMYSQEADVAGLTASNEATLEQISQVKATADGLSAQHTIKVQTGGIVSGIGLMSSNGVSAFAVRADQFYIAPPTGTSKGVVPFTVQTTPRTVNGVSVPAGTYINNAFIANGSIDIAKINKASITSLSALSANIGTLTTSDSRGTFTYTGSKIELRDPQGRLLMEMGLL